MNSLMAAACLALLLYGGVLVTRRYWSKPERRLLLTGRFRPDEVETLSAGWRQNGAQLVGIVGCGEWGEATLNYLGSTDRLGDVLDTHQIDGVYFDLSMDSVSGAACIRECQIRGIPIEFSTKSFAGVPSKAQLIRTDNGDVVRLIPHRQTPFGQTMKRLTDIVLSGAALLFLFPLLLLIALLVKFDSTGPVLFKQVRVGLRGRTFTMFKFRSMVADAEARKDGLTHLNEMNGPVFKIKDDPRVTKLGRFLRKTSLDELPQLWNVLNGEMSMVGPRPPLPNEVHQYNAWQRRRLTVKPGLTCFWQISGRNNIDFDQWMAMDLEYIDRWSYRLDWIILLKTLPAVLLRKGAS